MDTRREKMLREVMASDFAVIDLNLYLDTHPEDLRALALYNSYVQKAMMLRNNYEMAYGPLTPFYFNRKNYWEWVKSPWPWEIQ